MTQFEPLREGFREFNRLIIDSQQWDAQHQARQAKQEYDHSILMSNLQQREFDNRMRDKQFLLAERGEDRAAKQAEFLRNDADRNFKLTQEKWAHQQKVDKETSEINSLKKQQLEAELDKLLYDTEVTDLDFNGLVSPEMLANDGFMTEFNEQVAKNGFIVGEDLVGRNVDGTAIQMKRYQQAQFFPIVKALSSKYDNTHKTVADQRSALLDQYTELDKMSKGKDNYNFREKAEATREKNKLIPQIKNLQNFFTPQGQMEFHNKKALDLAQQSLWLMQNGNPELANSLAQRISHHENASLAMQEAMAKQQLKNMDGSFDPAEVATNDLFATELDAQGRAVFLGKGSYNERTNTWNYTDPVTGQLVTGALSLPEGMRVNAPTETFAIQKSADARRRETQDTKVMTEDQMIDVQGYFESEGMLGGITADLAKPKTQKISTAIMKVWKNHPGIKGDPALRGYAKTETIDKINQWESEYWDDVDALKGLSGKEVKMLANKLGARYGKDAGGKTAAQAVKDHYFYVFRDSIREMTGDDKFMIYRPNNTTRKMIRSDAGVYE